MMEFFLVTKLRRRIAACLAGALTPVHVADLFWELRPYMASHEIKLTDRGIILPALSSGSSPEVIYSDDVLALSSSRRGVLMLLLRNGDACLLSGQSSSRKRIHLCHQTFFRLACTEIGLRLWVLKESLLDW